MARKGGGEGERGGAFIYEIPCKVDGVRKEEMTKQVKEPKMNLPRTRQLKGCRTCERP